LANDLAADHIIVPYQIPEGYRGADFMGRLRNVGNNPITNNNILGRFWIYPDGQSQEASVLRDGIYGPFSVGAYESHYFTVYKDWKPGSYRILLQHNYTDDDASNNTLESQKFYVVTSTPTPTVSPTPTPTWTPTPTFTETPVPPTPTNTPATPTPTSSTYTNDIAAWNFEFPQTGSNWYQRRFDIWLKNTGTSTFNVGSGQPDGIRYKIYRRQLFDPFITTLVTQDRIPGPSESPYEWPVGRIGSATKDAYIYEWDPGDYDVWVEHDASNPTSETGYSEQDQNPNNDKYVIGFTVPSPTPTRYIDVAAISLQVPATPVYGGWKTIPFVGRIGNIGSGNVYESNIRGRMVLNPWPYDPSHEGHGDVIYDATGYGPFNPYPNPGYYEDQNLNVFHNWTAGYWYIRWEENYNDLHPNVDKDLSNDQIRSASFQIIVTPTPTNTPTPTATPTRPPLGLVIELDDKIWYFTRTGQYMVP